MIKFPKDKKVKPTDQSEVHQPVVGEAGPREADPKALVQPFAPMIEPRSIADLKVNHRNARTHSERQVEQIAASVLKFGFIIPIVVNEKGVVLAGHGRLRAAQRLGLEEVPTIVVKHLTEELQRAFMLADNRLAELAGWDEDLLRVELQELSPSPSTSNSRSRASTRSTSTAWKHRDWPKRRSRKWCRSWRATARQSAPPATCGSSASIFCCAAALWTKPPTRR